jgi:hypothetical protein
MAAAKSGLPDAAAGGERQKPAEEATKSRLEGHMNAAKLNLLVLKTRQLDRLRAFYAALGLSFAEERHGEGPLHLAARDPDGRAVELVQA